MLTRHLVCVREPYPLPGGCSVCLPSLLLSPPSLSLPLSHLPLSLCMDSLCCCVLPTPGLRLEGRDPDCEGDHRIACRYRLHSYLRCCIAASSHPHCVKLSGLPLSVELHPLRFSVELPSLLYAFQCRTPPLLAATLPPLHCGVEWP